VVELRARGIQGWELYQAVTLQSFNSTLGSFLAAALGVKLRVHLITSRETAPATPSLLGEHQLTRVRHVEHVVSELLKSLWRWIEGVVSCDTAKLQPSQRLRDVNTIFDAVSSRALMGAGGIGACAAITHILPGSFVFAPYILAGMLFTACFGVAVGWMLTMPGVACMVENKVPEGTFLNSAGEALAQTVWIMVATGYFVTSATLTVQYYAGVPYGQAIVNDWEARTSAKYVGCLARQLGGTVTNAQSNTVAFTDFIGIVL